MDAKTCEKWGSRWDEVGPPSYCTVHLSLRNLLSCIFSAYLVGQTMKRLENSILDLPEDLKLRVLHLLSPADLLRASQVNQNWCSLAELVFYETCKKHKWMLPKRPRGHAAVPKKFPWRALYMNHACRPCGKKGEFIVRRPFVQGAGTRPRTRERQWFLLCRTCTTKKEVQKRLKRQDVTFDLIGVSGKKLVNLRATKK